MSQVKRRTFDFAASGYGLGFLDYLGLQPSTTELLFGANAYGTGLLHLGYSPKAGQMGIASRVVAPTDTAGGYIKAFTHRETFAEDSTVEAAFALVPKTTAILSGQAMTGYGVAARITGGTIVSGTTSAVHLDDPSCYVFRMIPGGSSGTFFYALRTFQLVRYNAGVPTVLRTVSNFITPQIVNQLGDDVVELELKLTTSGADVDYICRVDVRGAVENVTVFSGTDVGGLTGSGRAGFMVGEPGPRTAFVSFSLPSFSLGNIAEVCESFEVRDSLDAVLIRDEWLRQSEDTYPLVNDPLSVIGSSAPHSAFAFDIFSGQRKIEFDTDHVEVLGVSLAQSIVGLLQHAAEDDKTQHRSVALKIPTGAHDEIWAGIALRGSLALQSTGNQNAANQPRDVTAYVATCGHVPSAGEPYQVRLYRINSPSTVELIAQLTDSAALFPVDGTQFTLDFEVYPQDNSPDPLTAPVKLFVSLDTGGGLTQVVLESVGATGVTVDVAGNVTDEAANRIQAGTAEGLYASSQNAVAVTVEFDDFTEETLHVPPVPKIDIPNLSVETEGAASASETLNDYIEPDFPFSSVPAIERLSLAYESGHRFSAPRQVDDAGVVTVGEVWRFDKTNATQYEVARLQAFFDRHRGVESAFFFEANGTTYTVAFVSPSITVARGGSPATYRVTFEVERLF